MQLSVVISTNFRHQHLKNCLQSIINQNINFDSTEVIVVSSKEDKEAQKITEHILNKIPKCKYLTSKQHGANSSRNTGIKFASGEIIYLLDDDCIVHNQRQLQTILQLHKKYPKHAAIGGNYLSADKSRTLCKLYNRLTDNWLKLHNESPHNANVLLGGNISYKKFIFQKSHFFDSSIKYGGSETEFHSRLLQEGFQLMYSEQLATTHNFAASWSSIPKKAWLQGYAKARQQANATGGKIIRTQRGLPKRRKQFQQLSSHSVPDILFHSLYYSIVQSAYFSTKVQKKLKPILRFQSKK